ncbi:type I polyketide synthase [Rugosimonospora acidiphila]|uniref:Type I polyketide synthase n=1 Tax=Rugosimonospora acidiphila TaxID=556531 RepID=A0ABP9RJN8_9ACTN
MSPSVVIVGMACRYPEAEDPEQLWENVLGRRRSFRRIPPQRLPLSEYGGTEPDRTYVTHAGLIEGWHFDRERFRIPGGTYRAVDTTHWLALEVSAAALASAGLPEGEGLDRDRVGVVLGNSLTGEFSRAALLRTRWPYVRRAVADALTEAGTPVAERDRVVGLVERRFKEPFPVPSDETLAGALANTIAGRVCNHFDFHGTGYTVDGACASSLLAVAAAATAVAEGQLDVALAGGVDLSLDPFELVGFARLGALARDEMRIFDRRPTGFLPGEGCGVVVLASEQYARRAGLTPYAYLRGWGTSSDGNGGLTRPELAGQRLALLRAYERAQLDPRRVGLIEAHGTGTEVGDLAELGALLAVRGPGADTAALGSVKANIGHTKAAAGVAGLIKATLAVHHEVLPPTTGCAEPHPMIAGSGGSLRVLDEARPWGTADRYAGVSAFGFGGINAHVVVGGVAPTRRHRLTRRDRGLAGRHPDRELVVCTADRPEQLAARLVRIRDAARGMTRGQLTDLAATLAGTERGEAPARFATAVATPDELAAAADAALARLEAGDRVVLDRFRRVFLVVGRPLRVGLLFSGQASPCYPDAGALSHLLDELPPGYDDALALPADREAAVDTAVAQPAIIRAALAGLRWLDTLGVRAHEALGHSLGELGALVWAGALDDADAYSLAAARGAAMSAADTGPAGMANLAADLSTVEQLLRGEDAVVAADNGDRRIVVSGTRASVSRVVAHAARRGIGATWLPVPHAFHSPLMAPAASRVKAAASAIDWRAAYRPVASTVTGERLADEDLVELLVRQLTAPVRFREALATLRAELLVEVGPGQVLAGLAGPGAVPMDAGAPSADGVATATAALFAAGAFSSAEPYFARRAHRRYDLDAPRTLLTNPCELTATGVPEVPAPDAAPPAAQSPAESADPVAAVVARVAAAAELDPAAIGPDVRLLADLHLSSLRVGQLAAEVAGVLGRAVPAAPLRMATATVAEFADAIAALPPAEAAPPVVAGIADWVRVFAARPVPAPAPLPVPRRWEIVGDLSGHPLAAAIREAFPTGPGEGQLTRLLALPPGLGPVPVGDVVDALRSCQRDGRPLVVLHHAGVGAAVGRSLAVEAPEVPVLVVEAPPTPAGIASAATEAEQDPDGYAEIVLGVAGGRSTPALRPLAVPTRQDARIGLGQAETCVVTGGAKGIGLECAVALAAATRARMVLLGRSAAADETVRAALRRIVDAGGTAAYRQVDVADPDAVAAVLGAERQRHGPVRGLLHAAGYNVPTPIRELDAAGVRAALAPKAAGLDNVLAALDLTELRFAVAFGSVIGRTGLAGEAHYAIANEWLARRCEQLAATAPAVRWLNIEWSAWAETGMGVHLGALDGLTRQGLVPIPTAEGVDLLLRLLAAPDLPPTVTVAGRLPDTPTLRWDTGGAPATAPDARFLESSLTHTPAVELVVAAELSLGTDPYLGDHRVDGMPVAPAVIALEAMAQAATALGGGSPRAGMPGAGAGRIGFFDVALDRPITVPDRGRQGLRVAALAGEDGGVELAVRGEETGFAVDHFRARYADPGDAPAPPGPPPAGELMPARHLYGPLFFHGPRFQRVLGFHALSAYRCSGEIAADRQARWFGAFLGQRLVLGDPGARDAFLHILQGCVPDRRVLPVGVRAIRAYRPPEGTLTLAARQLGEDGDEYLFDVAVTDATGAPVEYWQELRLRAISELAQPRLPIELLGAQLTRTLRRLDPQWTVDLAVARAGRTDHDRTLSVAGWLTGQAVTRTGAGRLLAAGAGTLSASHLDGHVLVATFTGAGTPGHVSGAGTTGGANGTGAAGVVGTTGTTGEAGTPLVAVDWELVGAAAPALSAADAALAGYLAGLPGANGDPPHAAAFRVWTCREAARKLGLGPTSPLSAEAADAGHPARLRCAGHPLASVVLETTVGPVAVCVGVR